jgi:hypothetical protein
MKSTVFFHLLYVSISFGQAKTDHHAVDNQISKIPISATFSTAAKATIFKQHSLG